MAQVAAVRQWKEPVHEGDTLSLDLSPIAKQQAGNCYEENLISTEELAIISKLVIS